MDILQGAIKGKPVTRIPVYLKKSGTADHIVVASRLEDIQKLLAEGGTWENYGPAPYDRNRAVLDSKPESRLTVTKEFQFFRITGIDGNKLTLYPEATFTPSVTWRVANRPRVGGYLVRHDTDYYTAMSSKLFERHFGNGIDPSVMKELEMCLEVKKGTTVTAEKSETTVDFEAESESA